MEPLDSDLEYMVSKPEAPKPGSRVNALLIFPILGILLVLLFIASAIFQINLSDMVDTIIGLLLLFFALFIVLIFWAKAPGADKQA
ncbi:MAG: hypothetical protein WCD86_16135 [Ktedonobacteraceae bacterium]|nr:hypothetical protein [Ktedonobacteraceae bacterium]